jgi:hypothetical protein
MSCFNILSPDNFTISTINCSYFAENKCETMINWFPDVPFLMHKALLIRALG